MQSEAKCTALFTAEQMNNCFDLCSFHLLSSSLGSIAVSKIITELLSMKHKRKPQKYPQPLPTNPHFAA